MNAVKNITIKLIAYLMIGIMMLFIVNRAVYLHSHVLEDGTSVVHAHPYNKAADSSPFKTHHHSNAELFFLQNLELLFFIFFISIALVNILQNVHAEIAGTSGYSFRGIRLYKGRAPPVANYIP